MQKNLDNIDSIIKKNFPNDINFKRIKKEILLIKQLNQDYFKISLQNSTLGLKIIFSTPSLADGRDLLSDILKKIWAPSILLHEIIVLIPNFMKEILKNPDDRASLQKLGVYHLGHTYNLEDFLVLDSVDVFPGTEILNNNKTVVRYITLSQAHLLSFEVLDKKKNLVKLITWANLQSLMNIKRKKDEESTLILTWKDNQKKEGTIQIFNLEDSSKFIELVIKNMKQFGVKVNKNKMVDKDLSEEDVTLKGYEHFNIEEILETIAVYESRLSVELTIDIVNTLMMLYQKCVEYYSALNDPAFETFVDRLHSLLSREDVQILLRSKEEVTKKKTSQDQGPKKSFIPDDDDEEEKKDNDMRRPPQQVHQEKIIKPKVEPPSSQNFLSQQSPEKPKINQESVAAQESSGSKEIQREASNEKEKKTEEKQLIQQRGSDEKETREDQSLLGKKLEYPEVSHMEATESFSKPEATENLGKPEVVDLLGSQEVVEENNKPELAEQLAKPEVADQSASKEEVGEPVARNEVSHNVEAEIQNPLIKEQEVVAKHEGEPIPIQEEGKNNDDVKQSAEEGSLEAAKQNNVAEEPKVVNDGEGKANEDGAGLNKEELVEEKKQIGDDEDDLEKYLDEKDKQAGGE